MGKRITIKWRRERAITSLKDDGIHQQIEDPVGGGQAEGSQCATQAESADC